MRKLANTHNAISIQKLLCDKIIYYVFIAKGLTSILQLLDVSIYKVFKEWIKRNYESAVSLFKTEKVPKVKKDLFLKWILDALIIQKLRMILLGILFYIAVYLTK